MKKLMLLMLLVGGIAVISKASDYNEGFKVGWKLGWKACAGKYSYPDYPPYPDYPEYGQNNLQGGINKGYQMGYLHAMIANNGSCPSE